jgi:hypothetical protein
MDACGELEGNLEELEKRSFVSDDGAGAVELWWGQALMWDGISVPGRTQPVAGNLDGYERRSDLEYCPIVF